MARRRRHHNRDAGSDPLYGSPMAQKLINGIMQDGKKSIAERILYDALEEVNKEESGSVLDTLTKAINNVKPVLEVKSRRVGGATYQVPIEVRPKRQQLLAIRWILQAANKRKGKSMQKKLAAELLDAVNRAGGAYKNREDVHRMAQANKAFAHYGW